MHVLITGGAGFIGSHLSHRLIEMGHRVSIIDNLSRGRRKNVPDAAELIIGDVQDDSTLAHLRRLAPNAVVHLAAQINVRSSHEDPVADAEANVIGTLKLLAAAQQAQVQCFALASSGGAIYGDECIRPTPEDGVVYRPKSPYGVSKLTTEMYLELFCRQSMMRGIALRLGNVFGPRQNTQGESGVIGLFIEAMAAGRPLLQVGDGKQTRDYIFVSDVVTAIVEVLERDDVCGPINLGRGIETTLTQLRQHLAALMHVSPALVHTASRGHEVRYSCLSIARARELLAWEPQVGLIDGLRRTLHALEPMPHLEKRLSQKNGPAQASTAP